MDMGKSRILDLQNVTSTGAPVAARGRGLSIE